jgi:hypothetical protein
MKKNPAAALEKAFTAQAREIVAQVEKIELNADASEDYNTVRNTLRRLLSTSDTALESLLALAQDSEHPRVFEVLAGLISTTGDIGARLMALQKTRHELHDLNVPPDKRIGTDRAVAFIGSTAELQKFLKQKREENIIDVTPE